MVTKAYQCSKCKLLRDCDEYVDCIIGIDPRPGHREKENTELCKKNFTPLEPKERWHEKFSWES